MFSEFTKSVEKLFPLTGNPKKDVEIMKQRWAYLQCKTNGVDINVDKGDPCYECDNLSCKRDHDAETYLMNRLFKLVGMSVE